MVELYNAELDHVRKNYDLVSKLDADLLKEFDVTPARILGCLRARLGGLRHTYWKELIGNMGQETDRLCSKQRQRMLDKLNQSGHVDFTRGNIHAVIIWILKNANQYLGEQLIEVFDDMVEKANVRNYKSNQRAFTHDRWRYNEEKPSHIALEFRLVLEHCGGIGRTWRNANSGLSERADEFLGDLLTVARNLGFDCTNRGAEFRGAWESGLKHIFTMPKTYKVGDKVMWGENSRKAITGKVQLDGGKYQYKIEGQWYHESCLPGEPLIEVRAYQNNNLHVRLNQEFALALNVEYGRLKGWLKTGAEAADELGDKNAARHFDSQLQLGQHSLLMLAGPESACPAPVIEVAPEFAFGAEVLSA